VRASPPTATGREVELGDFRIPASEKALLLLASANRDPERWQGPDRFDITRRVQGHVGFGVGFHVCVGQVIARMEGELLLTALAQRVASIDLAGPPIRRFNNAVRGVREPAAWGATASTSGRSSIQRAR
jgi:4-methoxybenzoate monooxygenase (O-demethylating)